VKILSAPWRMDYLKGDKEAGCIFCTRLKRDKDEADLILVRGKKTFTILNKYPYSNGHLMVVPYEHNEDLGSIAAETAVEIFDSLNRWQKILESTLKTQGFNIGVNIGKAGGAGVTGHIHFHLVPRWEGDANFMTVASDTRVMPESIEDTYRSLKAAWGKA
jgi:ATP adenylyltransferase